MKNHPTTIFLIIAMLSISCWRAEQGTGSDHDRDRSDSNRSSNSSSNNVKSNVDNKLFKEALAAYEINNLEPAISKFKQVIEKDPEHTEAHFYLANCYVKNKKYEQAVPLFEKATKLKPDYFDAFISLGKTLNLLDRSGEAETVFKKAIKLKPKDSSGFLNLGIAQKAREKLQRGDRLV